jgi:probable F420-dependent oxidoreductase
MTDDQRTEPGTTGFLGAPEPNIEPDRLRDRARRAEEAGFESLWVGDHIALPSDAPDSATEPRLEAITALTYLAAVTSRIRLGVGVLVLPQRQPVLLAKQLASLDTLSRGRLTVGVGVGYVAAELAAFGVSLADRAALTDEHIDAMIALWNHADRFEGGFVSFAGVAAHPGPVQRPHPPIVVGGHSPAAIERAARAGDGWFGWEVGVEEAADLIGAVHAARAASSRTDRVEISIAPAEPVTARLAERYAELGVDRLVLVPDPITAEATDAMIEHAATELLAGPVVR